jgi:hypothetical protein
MATSATYPLMKDSTGQQIVTALDNINANIIQRNEQGGGSQGGGSANIIANNSAAHNSIYRGKDLTNIYTITEIADMIRDDDLEDLYIGDYFTTTISTSIRANENVGFIIAGFDTYVGVGDQSSSPGATKHHAVLVMKDCFTDLQQMNSSNTTTGGYKGSSFYTTTLPKYVTGLTNLFGDRLLTRRALVSNAMTASNYNASGTNTGAASGWEWVTESAGLMTECELYGAPIYSSSYYDQGEACVQLPLFALAPQARIAHLGLSSQPPHFPGSGRVYYWLRSININTKFCLYDCVSGSNSYYNFASTHCGVRLRLLLG